MSGRVRVERDGAGSLVAVKGRASVDGDRALLEEHAILSAARHPGVVDDRGLRATDGRLELLLSWAGGRSLQTQQEQLRPAALARLGAALCETVADLHDIGVAHGALTDPSHVIIDPNGHPVLCGFGRAQLLQPDAPGQRAADVHDLGYLLRTLVGPLPDDAPFLPTRRWRRRSDRDDLRAVLLTLADRATADDPGSRPTARCLAHALRDVAPPRREPPPPHPLPAGRLGSGPDDAVPAPATEQPDEPGGHRRLPARWRRGALLLAALGAGTIGAGALAPVARPSGAPAAGSTPPGTAATEPTTATTAGRTPEPTAGPEGDTGPTLLVDGATYVVGAPGDEVALGQWSCDGRRLAAVLRSATGEVFLFDGWADRGDDLVATPITTIPDATSLSAGTGPTDCPGLVAHLPDGRVVDVAVGP